mgnify:FL=1
MPKGQTSRPYNRSIKTIAKAKKKLAGRTKNASTNKVDGMKSNAKTGRGSLYANDTRPSDSSVSMMRQIGARNDQAVAASIRKKKKATKAKGPR